MTFDELVRKVLAILPNATLDEDLDGQIVIYTDLREYSDGQIRPFNISEGDD